LGTFTDYFSLRGIDPAGITEEEYQRPVEELLAILEWGIYIGSKGGADENQA